MRITVLIFLSFLITSVGCKVFQPKSFSQAALDATLVSTTKDTISLREILSASSANKTVIEVYASYCPYSQKSFSKIKKLQEKSNGISYVFLSVDHSFYDWKRGLSSLKEKVSGAHYYLVEKGKGNLGEFLKLQSIPRFLLLREDGSIEVFKTSEVEKLERWLLP
ncbi:thioredoxin-like domain-containing protein [Tenacibaculum sp. SG-28]|uniref:TlpA family protein disulfide reductase n=1 Tax=Tenacibaculum sp. SG-28 TaxID=754426 RepID=UPI000CF39849|nr:thioredoxin-like domain-containing protein [Tenacibaculum sp. SG-28]PQJ20642.1 hypothetical protein BSU00_10070 [Tenacibaculum sp. SG-28]